jgi:hypothetical protein
VDDFPGLVPNAPDRSLQIYVGQAKCRRSNCTAWVWRENPFILPPIYLWPDLQDQRNQYTSIVHRLGREMDGCGSIDEDPKPLQLGHPQLQNVRTGTEAPAACKDRGDTTHTDRDLETQHLRVMGSQGRANSDNGAHSQTIPRGPSKHQSKDVLRHFASYARYFVRRYFPRLGGNDVVSFEEWARNSARTEQFLNELRSFRRENHRLSEKDISCEVFLKFEPYAEPKFPRSICSPHDNSKAVLQSYFHAIEERLYKLPWFVKHITAEERAEKLDATLGAGPVIETDFSSFECHHVREFAKIGAFWIGHVLGSCHGASTIRSIVNEMFLGDNAGRAGSVRFRVSQRLMSGAVWTSCANGVLNLLLMSYCVLKTRYQDASPRHLAKQVGSFRGLIEGDDGICASSGIDPGLITALGLKLKMSSHASYCEASFCGITKPDNTRKTILCDPLKTICNFFVLRPEFEKMRKTKSAEQIRAKALCYALNYPNCPIVGPLAVAALERTKSIYVDPKRYDDSYHRALLKQAIRKQSEIRDLKEITAADRVVVEERYGFSPDWQRCFETEIAKWGRHEPHCLPNHPRLDKHLAYAMQYLHPTTQIPFVDASWRASYPDPLLIKGPHFPSGETPWKPRVKRDQFSANIHLLQDDF